MSSSEAGLLKKYNIGVVVSFNDAYSDMARVSVFENIDHYCKLYGYTLHIDKQESKRMDRYAAWNKIIACIDALPLYDWIFYIDVDCIIMNHSKMLETFISDDYSFIIPAHNIKAVDTPVLNEVGTDCVITSQFFVKNDEVGMAILEDIWQASDWPADMDINEFDHEGRQTRVTINKPQFSKRVKVVEEHVLNRFWYVNNPFINFHNKGVNDNIWQSGDFIVHVSNYSVKDRTNLLDMLNHFSGGEVMGYVREPSIIKFTCFDDLEDVWIDLCNENNEVMIKYYFEQLSYKITYILYTDSQIDQQNLIVKAYRKEELISARYLPCKK
jgi:hypothetical protein